MLFFTNYREVIKKHGQKHNLLVKSGEATMAYLFLDLIFISATIFTCYRFQPTKKLLSIKWIDNYHQQLKKQYKIRYHLFIKSINNRANWISNHHIIKPIPQYFKAKPRRFTISVAEALIYGRILSPITFPLHLWMVKKSVDFLN